MECMRNQLVRGVLLDGRFETISPLNHGSFGMVFMAKDHQSGDNVAVKCLTKTASANTCPSAFAVDEHSEEMVIHRRIGTHPNIVSLICSFETDNHIHLVLEYCANGDLYEAIRLGKGPQETQRVREFMLQLVGAVEYMHSKGIYHRDIKPENIFLTHSGSMKLGDFGLATSDEWSYESAVGSDRYMAPEQYDPAYTGYSPAKADIWAIGICLLNVLFSRNPFAVPNTSDPLFADFAGDKQTLFDVFPNMSQDTFEVLMHCLAVDPSKRSLSGIRDALDRVISFTTDDETLDEFCTEDRNVIRASANREPLRTPSISSPQTDNGSFPWAKALALSPPQQVRQLSAIPDTEPFVDDMFPSSLGSNNDWCYIKPDNASIFSFVDSGLGVSVNSDNSGSLPVHVTRSKPLQIAGSLPIDISKPGLNMSGISSMKLDTVSKSWSDLWDEEEELRNSSEMEHSPLEKDRGLRNSSQESQSGVSTPRAPLAEVKNPSIVHNRRSHNSNGRNVDHRVSEHTGFIFEDHPGTAPRNSSPFSKRSILDKWAALGDRRRGNMTTHQSGQSPPPQSRKPRLRSPSWKRQFGWGANHHNDNSGVLERKDWSLSKDWRQPTKSACEDIGDLEWVGGWHDLHV